MIVVGSSFLISSLVFINVYSNVLQIH